MQLNEFQQAFGKRVRIARQQKLLSLKQLSAMQGMSEGYLSRLECGKINATLDVMRRLAQSLDVPARFFFDW